MTEARHPAGNRHRAEGESGRRKAEYYSYSVSTDATDRIRELTRNLIGTHWTYQERMREILEWVCPTDRQFEHAQKEWIKIADGQERTMRTILASFAHANREVGDAVQAR